MMRIKITGEKYTSVYLSPDLGPETMSTCRTVMEDSLRRSVPLNKTIVLFPIEWREQEDITTNQIILTAVLRWGKMINENE